MTRYSPGAVVLVRFPFTHLESTKKRPAVVISPAPYSLRHDDVVTLALTSRSQPEPFLRLQHWQPAGLLGPTWIKPAVFTLAESVIDGRIGSLDPEDGLRIPQALGLLIDERYLP